jgi:hypothetical protein
MGGWGSGRQGGRPTADSSLFIDLAWMLRTGRAREGSHYQGSLSWTCRGEESGRIGYIAAMNEPGDERLELIYSNTRRGERKDVRQLVRLTFTQPHYGGKRWWMLCPVSGRRVGKLYLPPGGDIFASRQAWRLGYQSQRDAPRDRPFERLFRLQKKLGSPQGWEAGLFRPRGMWHRTFNRHMDRYWALDEECAAEMDQQAALCVARLLGR